MGSTVEKIIYADFGRALDEIEDTMPIDHAKVSEIEDTQAAEPQSVEIGGSSDWDAWNTVAQDISSVSETLANSDNPSGGSRDALLKKLMVLASGLTVGIALAFPLLGGKYSFLPDSGERAVHTETDATFEADTTEAAALLDDSQLEQVVAQPSKQVSVPSHILEYATEQPIPVGVRDYLYLKDSERAYGPALTSVRKAPGGGDALKAEVPTLNKVPGDEGRFVPQDGSLQWQGSWEVNNPKRNIELGSAYKDYLDKTLGNSEMSNLSSFREKPAKFLPKMGKARGNSRGKLRRHAK